MVSHNHPTILLFVAVNSGDHIPDLPRLVIHLGFQMNTNIVAPAYVVRKREATLKSFGPQWTTQRLEQPGGITIRDWLHRYAREIVCFLDLQPVDTWH